METKEIKEMIKAIYAQIDKSGLTSHIYNDAEYSKVFELRYIAQNVAKTFNVDLAVVFEYVDEYQTCKRYHVSIEDEFTGERFGGGCIVACFAGSVENPRDRYDVCATWWID